MTIEDVKRPWEPLSYSRPAALTDTIAQIHRLGQFLAMLGKHYLPHQTDDSETNLGWLDNRRMLLSRKISGNQPFHLAIASKELKLLVLDESFSELDSIEAKGKTKAELTAWVKQHIDSFGLDTEKYVVTPHYDLPAHNTDDGKAFMYESPEFYAEWEKYRHNANLMISYVASKLANSSEVRIWPHHFDTGSLVTVAINDSGEAQQTIGIGMAIPDNQFNEPYFYINFWSAAGTDSYEQGVLDRGQWVPDKWKGLILKASDIVSIKSKEEQVQMVQIFYRQGVRHTLNILGKPEYLAS